MVTQSPMVRAMATCLHDNDIDPLHADSVVTALVRAGYTAKLIETHYEAVVLMALIRRRIEGRDAQSALAR